MTSGHYAILCTVAVALVPGFVGLGVAFDGAIAGDARAERAQVRAGTPLSVQAGLLGELGALEHVAEAAEPVRLQAKLAGLPVFAYGFDHPSRLEHNVRMFAQRTEQLPVAQEVDETARRFAQAYPHEQAGFVVVNSEHFDNWPAKLAAIRKTGVLDEVQNSLLKPITLEDLAGQGDDVTSVLRRKEIFKPGLHEMIEDIWTGLPAEQRSDYVLSDALRRMRMHDLFASFPREGTPEFDAFVGDMRDAFQTHKTARIPLPNLLGESGPRPTRIRVGDAGFDAGVHDIVKAFQASGVSDFADVHEGDYFGIREGNRFPPLAYAAARTPDGSELVRVHRDIARGFLSVLGEQTPLFEQPNLLQTSTPEQVVATMRENHRSVWHEMRTTMADGFHADAAGDEPRSLFVFHREPGQVGPARQPNLLVSPTGQVRELDYPAFHETFDQVERGIAAE